MEDVIVGVERVRIIFHVEGAPSRGLEARKEEGASPGQGLKEVPYSWGKSQVGGEGL